MTFDTVGQRASAAHPVPVVPDNPEEAADAVVSGHVGTCESYLRHVAGLIYLCCNKFQLVEEQTRFSRRLEKLCFLSARDAAAPMRSSSKLSMLRKIGCYADLFCSPSVLPFLAPEHSKLYQLALLFELVGCNTERFVVELEQLGSDFTRDDAITRIAEIKAEMQPQKSATAEQAADDSDTAPTDNNAIPIDLIVGTIGAKDARVLRRDMADVAELDRLLPRPDLSQSAALVVLTKLSELSVVETRLAPHFGFSRISHIFLVGNAGAIDLIDQQVLVVTTRGKVSCVVPETVISISDNVADIATVLFGDAERKFHLFDDSKGGWQALEWNDH